MKYFIEKSDKRSTVVHQILNQKGLDSQLFSFEEITGLNVSENDYIVFAPAKKFNTNDIHNLPNDTNLICGNLSNEHKEILKQKNITHLNIMENETFAIKNANLTAEGVLALILTHSQISYHENNILILGGGRIALALARIFNNLNINFAIVTYNKEKLPHYYLYTNKCYLGEDFIKDAHKFDIVINTIPAVIINKDNINAFDKFCTFIETASINCIEDNTQIPFNYLAAPALPSKYCLHTAGKYMCEYILGEI